MIPEPEFKPYDSPNRWLIESRTKWESPYLVDLGRPECQCRWFACRCKPLLEEGKHPKHIKMCWHYDKAKERKLEWSIWNDAMQDPNKSHDDEQL